MKTTLAITLMLLVLSGCATSLNLTASVPQGQYLDITITTNSSESTE